MLLLPGCGIFKFTPPPQAAPEEPPKVNVVQRAVDNTVALVNAEGRFCTGVLAEGVGLTAAHCLNGEIFFIEDQNGKLYDAAVAILDEEHDLAVITAIGLSVKDSVPLAPNAPGLGQKVVWTSYPLGGHFTLSVGIVANPSVYEGTHMAIQGQIFPGDSGSPVFNEFGELVGIATSSLGIPAEGTPQLLPLGYVVHFDHVKALLDAL